MLSSKDETTVEQIIPILKVEMDAHEEKNEDKGRDKSDTYILAKELPPGRRETATRALLSEETVPANSLILD